MTARALSLGSAADTEVPSPSAEASTRAGWVVRRGWVLAVVVALPAVVAALSIIGRHWFPASDWALELLRVNDVGTSHTPLVGVPSRYGWYHPGPWIFWVLTPSYWLFGTTGTLVGTGLINAVAIGGTIYTARRRGGAALGLWCGVLVAVLVHTFGPAKLVDPWNPWLALMPFLCFTLLAWSVGCGDLAALPWAAGVGSFVVETHIGYAPIVAAQFVICVLVGAGVVWWRRRHGVPDGGEGSRRSAWFWAGLCALVLAVFWLPPLLQQVAGGDGNLAQIWHYFRHPSAKAVGWTPAVGIFGRQLSVLGPWINGHEPAPTGPLTTTYGAWPAALLLLVTGLLGIAAWRRKAVDAAWLAAFAVLSAVAGLVATSRVNGEPFPYLVRWWWVIALLQWLAIGWCVARILCLAGSGADHPRRELRRGAGAVIGVAIAALTFASTAAALPTALPQEPVSAAIGSVAQPTASALNPRTVYSFDTNGDLVTSSIALGLFTELRRRGYHVYAGPSLSNAVGAFRVRAATEATATIHLRNPYSSGPPLPRGAQVLARYDPLTMSQRAELNRLNQQLRLIVGNRAPPGLIPTEPPLLSQTLIRWGASPHVVHRLDELETKGSALVVYLTPNQHAASGG